MLKTNLAALSHMANGKWLLFAIFTILLLGIFDPLKVFARDAMFRAQNDVLYYDDECAPGSSGSSSSSTPLEGSDNAQKVWNYFKSKGFSDEQTAGIMGNLAWESGDPTFNKATSSEELSGGGGFGLGQWTGGRRTDLVNTAKDQDRSVTDLGYQLDYLYNEMKTRTERDGGSKTEEQGMKEQTSVESATEYFMYNFERPGDLRLKERTDYAKQYLEKYGGTGSSGGSSSSGDCGEGAGSSNAQCGEGGLIGTLKCYAWPEYKGSGYTTPTEDYKKAVERAQSEGRYVGGNSMPGIDCGAFVTILLNDSGYEPGYNYNGRGGATGQQYKWTSENWKVLGKGNEINIADLKPGDVANDRDNHTFMWVGQVDGFEPTNIASASLEDRAPMAGHENATQARWTWFGKR